MYHHLLVPIAAFELGCNVRENGTWVEAGSIEYYVLKTPQKLLVSQEDVTLN